jgi:hypothetical protein
MSEWKIQHPIPKYHHRTFAEGKAERIANRTGERQMSDLKTLLKTEPLLTKYQQQAFTTGPAALMDPLDAYKLGWRMALSHVRYALKAENAE